MRRRDLAFAVTLAACAAGPGTSPDTGAEGPSEPALPTNCDLRAVAAEILDEGYLDCGDYSTDQDSAAGTACAVDALVAADPFLLVVETSGTDSLGTMATVYRDGRLLFLNTDAFIVFDPGPVTALECVDPFVPEGGLVISCESLLPRSPGHDYYDVCTPRSEGVIPLPEPWYTWAALASI